MCCASGDGGPANVAGIGGVSAIATDNSGNVYFTDDSAGTVRNIDSQRNVVTVVAPVVSLKQPTALAVDPSGNLYVSYTDILFGTSEIGVFEFSPNGEQINSIDNPYFQYVYAFAINSQGAIYLLSRGGVSTGVAVPRRFSTRARRLGWWLEFYKLTFNSPRKSLPANTISGCW